MLAVPVTLTTLLPSGLPRRLKSWIEITNLKPQVQVDKIGWTWLCFCLLSLPHAKWNSTQSRSPVTLYPSLSLSPHVCTYVSLNILYVHMNIFAIVLVITIVLRWCGFAKLQNSNYRNEMIWNNFPDNIWCVIFPREGRLWNFGGRGHTKYTNASLTWLRVLEVHGLERKRKAMWKRSTHICFDGH